MSGKFKVGDKVIRTGGHRKGIKQGHCYTVCGCSTTGSWIVLTEAGGRYYAAGLFEKAPADAPSQPDNVLNRRPHYDLIIAWANGAEIECKVGSIWVVALEPMFNANVTYRIKPTEAEAEAEREAERKAKEVLEVRKELDVLSKRLKQLES